MPRFSLSFNLKDFPEETLNRFGIEAVHPDTFVEQQMDLHEAAVLGVAKSHRAALRTHPSRPTTTWVRSRPRGWLSRPVACSRLRASSKHCCDYC